MYLGVIYKHMRKNNHGFAHVAILIVVLAVAVVGVAAWRVFSAKDKENNTVDSGVTEQSTESSASWSMDGSEWKASGTPPDCADPLSIPSPADISKATAILYPGQYRGSDYKPHGGMRFDGSANEDITVTVPQDAEVYKASRYYEQGEVQYLFAFIAPCGIMYKFDHLLTLSADFQALANKLPEPTDGDSRTTDFVPRPLVKAGDVIATAVGFKNTDNVGFDFGVYDLRSTNAAYESDSWKAEHQNDNEYAPYAICWLDYLAGDAKAVAQSLPAGDGVNGKTSDYCD